MASLSLNKVVLIGNVGREPEIRTTQDGREIASFSLATTESWKDKSSGERRERTEWHKIVVFAAPLINIIKSYIHKGSKLYIEGAIQSRKWTDQSGAEKMVTEIVLQGYSCVMMMLDSRGGGASASSEGDENHSRNPAQLSSRNNTASNLAEELDDEIPF